MSNVTAVAAVHEHLRVYAAASLVTLIASGLILKRVAAFHVVFSVYLIFLWMTLTH